MDTAGMLGDQVLSKLRPQQENTMVLSNPETCQWCRAKPVRADGAQLSSDCHYCHDCKVKDGKMFQLGSQLLCEPCNDRARTSLQARRDAFDLGKRIEAAGFYKAHEKSSLAALDARQKKIAIEYLSQPFGNLIIYGGSGSGKTWTANAVIKTLIERGYSGRWLSVPWLFASLRDWIGADDGKRFEMTDYVNKLMGFDYIVLDDLGAHRATDWAIETLYLILDQWEAHGKRGIICTTNLSMDEIAKNFSDRIASRLAAACRVVKLEGDDKRLKRQTMSPTQSAPKPAKTVFPGEENANSK